jgi:histidyl-tRNA synthetase
MSAQFVADERDEVPFVVIVGRDELKEGFVAVKEQRWQLVDGHKVKVESADKGERVSRAEDVSWLEFTWPCAEWDSGTAGGGYK